MRKIISCVLACMLILSAVAFSGCSSVDEEGAERSLKVYFSALSGFNMKAMDENVIGENEDGDFGFEIKELSEDYSQSDNYKKRVEDMMKTLSGTISFDINSRETVDENTVKFNVTMKYADVNERELNQFVIDRTDRYYNDNLEKISKMDEFEYNEEMIGVYADTYEEFVTRQGKTSKDFELVVTKVDGNWRVETVKNKEFFKFLEELFVGNESVNEELPEEVEEATEEVEE